MIRQYVRTFLKTVKPVRTGRSNLHNPSPIQKRIKNGQQTPTIKMKSKDLILNRFKVGGKIRASQVQMKIKSFLLGERVDANLFSNEINFIHFFFI